VSVAVCPTRRFRRVCTTAALVMFLVFSTGTLAQDPRVRVSLKDDQAVWVGQQMVLVVELLAPGYFASAAAFDLPEPAGVLLMPPQNHPVVGNETIDGTLYTVQRHELPAWAMRADAGAIPAFTVRFSYKEQPLDKDETPATVTTTEIPVTVKTPPGAEGLGTVISARNLDIRDVWDPTPGTEPVKAGTAYKRSITFTAPGVPGMLFPVFPAGEIDGLGIYTKHGVQDRSDRGVMVGESVDAVTYVLQSPGTYTLPAANFTWFDPDAGQLITHTFPEQVFEVIANPDQASVPSVGESGDTAAGPLASMDRRTIGWLMLAAVAVLVLALLALNSKVRRRVSGWLTPLRPVHLQPLNPPDRVRR